MVVSEIAAATLIAVCGLKRSYRIILRGERFVRRTIKRPSPIVEGYDSFPRFFIRRVFHAGLGIAMRWEGRAQNAAQRAANARMRAKRAGTIAAQRAEEVRAVAKDRAAAVRVRADEVRAAAKDRAAAVRVRADEVRAVAKDRAAAVRERVEAEYRRRQSGPGGDASGESLDGRHRSIVPPKEDLDNKMKMVHTRFR